MRFVTYRKDDGTNAPGVIEGDSIRTITTPTMRAYVELAPHERIAWHSGDELIPLAEAHLEAPLHPARNVFCLAGPPASARF